MATTEKDTEEDGVQIRRGILKNRSEDKHHSGVQWDEMNILMTFHPPDKDYGHMKINEPPTPYSKFKDPVEEGGEGSVPDPISDDEADGLDPKHLSQKMKDTPRRESWEDPGDNDDDEEEEPLTEDQKEMKKHFKEHRKQHYNEFAKVKLARKLIEQELKDLEDDDDETVGTSTDKTMEES